MNKRISFNAKPRPERRIALEVRSIYARQMGASFVYKEDRRQAAMRFVGCIAVGLLGYWMLTSDYFLTTQHARPFRIVLAGWLAMGFFGTLTFRYAWAVLKPGTLTFTDTGLKQDLGWRCKSWLWTEIKEARLVGRATTACRIYPVHGWPVSLFGWDGSAEELTTLIQNRISPPSS